MTGAYIQGKVFSLCCNGAQNIEDLSLEVSVVVMTDTLKAFRR